PFRARIASRALLITLHGDRTRPADFTGKRVGIIGTGATAIQAIPEIGQNQRQRSIGRQDRNGALNTRRRRSIWLCEKIGPVGAISSTRWHCSVLERYASFRCSSSSCQISSKPVVCASSSATASAIALPSI